MDNKRLNEFLDEVFYKLKEAGIDVSDMQLDHVAYQTKNKQEYENLTGKVSKFYKNLWEIVIDNRRISVNEFTPHIKYRNYVISAIEIVEPKDNEKCNSYFQHAEFVITCEFPDLINKYPNLDWNTTHIFRKDFPRLKLELGNTIEVKFHHASILAKK
ncbi:VOC family protein [Candidatus Woesebacteria bacterium]|nr:MAG: VOC family protein [Candidatus Woesebacteria bacterium]